MYIQKVYRDMTTTEAVRRATYDYENEGYKILGINALAQQNFFGKDDAFVELRIVRK